jgi:drug/metabolite transporter (DMT)-like permease
MLIVMNSIIYFIITVIGWSLPNFFIKNLRRKFESIEVIIFLHLIYTLFILPFIFITFFKDKSKIIEFKNKVKSLKPLVLASAFLVVVLGISAQYGFNSLLKNNDVTYVVPIIRGVSSLLILSIGYFIFAEKMTIKKVLGILAVISGVYLISSK